MGIVYKGILNSFDAGTYTASVEVAGSHKALLTGVPVARNIASGEMSAGRYVVLASFGEGGAADAAIIAVHT